jgi:type IV pilus assembly protein PilQ
VLGCLLLLGPVVSAGLDVTRLVRVSLSSEGSLRVVVIETSEPAPYLTARPDPLTVYVDLRDVDASGAPVPSWSEWLEPVASVRLEPVSVAGFEAMRVRVQLTSPVPHRVRSVRNTIRIELDTSPAPARGAAVPATAGTGGRTLFTDDSAGATVRAAGAPPLPVPLEPSTAGTPAAASRQPPQGPPVVPSPSAVAQPPPLPPLLPALRPAAPQPPPSPQPPTSQPPQPPAIQPPPEKKYTGHPVSFDFQQVPLRDVLRLFGDISGLNILIDPAVQGTVDVVWHDVPWDEAFEELLRSNKLGYVASGTIIRIAPLSVLADEEAQRRKLAEEQALSGELQVLTRTLSYAKASQLQALITKTALSPRGLIQVDERTNTLIMTDLPEKLATALKLIDELDLPEPQVEIEARIVQTTREFARAIGVQWGTTGRVSQELANTTGLAFPNRGSVTGRTGATQGPADPRAGASETAATVVNLPATNATSAIGIQLGAVNASFNLDIALSALERTGRGRVLSTPRISTQNNVEAEVTQGVQIPYQTTANNTVTVSFKDAALQLKVLPQITTASTVIMRIVLENASPDFSRQVNGVPPIDTQRAVTQVQIKDGETTVIGGIFVSREQSAQDRTPGLHRIPLLGWLFRRDSVQDESRELLIFIRPRILR